MAEQYTKSEFLNIFKEKYPEYNDVEDNLLFDRVMKKYPEYQASIIPEPTQEIEKPLYENQENQIESNAIDQRISIPQMQSEIPDATSVTTQVQPQSIEMPDAKTASLKDIQNFAQNYDTKKRFAMTDEGVMQSTEKGWIEYQQPELRPIPEGEVAIEKGRFERFTNFISDIVTGKGKELDRQKQKALLIADISNNLDLPMSYVRENYDELVRNPEVTGIQGDPTTMEMLETGMTGAIGLGFVTNPISMAIGAGTFLAIDEVENLLISKINDDPYHVGAGKGLKDLLPEQASSAVKNTVEMIDFIGKAFAVGGGISKAKASKFVQKRPELKKFSKNPDKYVYEKVTKEFITKYNMPKTIQINADKLDAMGFVEVNPSGKFGGTRKVLTPEAKQLFKQIKPKMTEAQILKMVNEGKNIPVQTSEIIFLADKPWWQRAKGIFGVEGKPKVVSITPAGKGKAKTTAEPYTLEFPKDAKFKTPKAKPKVETKPVRLPEAKVETKTTAPVKLKQGEGFAKETGLENVKDKNILKLHEENRSNPYTEDLEIEFRNEPGEVVLTEQQIIDRNYSPEYFEQDLIKEGEPGYVKGENNYRLIEAGSNSADGKKTILNSGATADAYVEDAIIEPIYKRLQKENPELLQRIKAWESAIERAAQESGIELPTGIEIFSKAYGLNRLQYADQYPELAELAFLPEDIVKDFDAYAGPGVSGVDPLKGTSPIEQIRLTEQTQQPAIQKIKEKPIKPETFSLKKSFDKKRKDIGVPEPAEKHPSIPVGPQERALGAIFNRQPMPTKRQLQKQPGSPGKGTKGFDELVQTLESEIKKNPEFGFWYYDFGKGIKDISLQENMREASINWGITSAQNAVEINLSDQLHIMILARQINPIKNPNEFRAALRKPKANGNKLKVTGRQIDAIMKMYETGTYQGGIKISNYMASTELAVENKFMPFTVNDVHMGRFFGYPEGATIGVPQHRYMQYLSSKLGENFDIYPQQVQALGWKYAKENLSPVKDQKRIKYPPNHPRKHPERLKGDGSWESALEYAAPEIAIIRRMQENGEWVPSEFINPAFKTAPLPGQKNTIKVKGKDVQLTKKTLKDKNTWTNTLYIDDIIAREKAIAPRLIVGFNPGVSRGFLSPDVTLSSNVQKSYWSDIMKSITDDRGRIKFLEELKFPYIVNRRLGSWGALEIANDIILPGGSLQQATTLGAFMGDAFYQDAIIGEKPTPKGKDTGMLLEKQDGTPFTEKEIVKIHKILDPKVMDESTNFSEMADHSGLKFFIESENHAKILKDAIKTLQSQMKEINFKTGLYSTESNYVEKSQYQKIIKNVGNQPRFRGSQNILRAADNLLYKPIWEVYKKYSSKFGTNPKDLKRPEPGKVTFSLKPKSKTLDQLKLERRKKEEKNKLMNESAKEMVDKKTPDIIYKRHVYGATKGFENEILINELNEKTTSLEREAIPFLIEFGEKIKDVNLTPLIDKLGRKDLYDILSKDGIYNELQPIVKQFKNEFSKLWDMQVEWNEDLSDKALKDYVTHIWDVPKNKQQGLISWFTTNNKFQNKRYINTLMEGIEEFDLKPKYLDIGKTLRIYANTVHQTIANKQFIKDMRSLKNTNDLKLITTAQNAPPEWKEIRHPAMKNPVTGAYDKAHPDIAVPLEKILGAGDYARSNGKVLTALESINGFMKKINLSFSFFHHLALSEAAAIIVGPVKTFKHVNPITFVYRGMIKGDNLAWQKADVAKDFISSGGQLGATADIPVDKIQAGLDVFQTRVAKIPGLSQSAKGLSKINEAWDRALWDYLHDGFKILAYENLINKHLHKYGEADKVKVKRELAQFVNDTFGGQNWDLLMVSPKMQQFLSLILLSPDWLASTTRQALSVTGIGSVYKDPEMIKLRKKMGAKFWLNGLLFFGTMMNALNIALREHDIKENPDRYPDIEKNKLKPSYWWERSMFGNTIGSKTKIFYGRDEQGREEYLRWGKQFKELPEMFYDDTGLNFPQAAIKRVGSKASPLLQYISQVFTSKTLSGFENYDVNEKIKLNWVMGLFKTTVKSALPYATQNALREDKKFKLTDLFVPSSAGMTNKKARKLFKLAITNGDYNMLRETYMGAIANDIDPLPELDKTISEIKGDYLYEIVKFDKTRDSLMKKLNEYEEGTTEHLFISQKIADLDINRQKVDASYKIVDLLKTKMEVEYLKLPKVFPEPPAK